MSEPPAIRRWPSPRETARLLGLETELGDELVPLLEAEPAGLSASELALRVRRRDVAVRDALARDRRFVRTGRGPSTRWRLAANPWEEMGGGIERFPDHRAVRNARGAENV